MNGILSRECNEFKVAPADVIMLLCLAAAMKTVLASGIMDVKLDTWYQLSVQIDVSNAGKERNLTPKEDKPPNLEVLCTLCTKRPPKEDNLSTKDKRLVPSVSFIGGLIYEARV